MGRYLSQPLKVKCEGIRDVQQVLAGCKYISDKDLFDQEEYWQPRKNSNNGRRVIAKTLRSGRGGNGSRWDTTFALSSGGPDATQPDMRG